MRALALALTGCLIAPSLAAACSFPGNVPLELVPNPDDVTAPTPSTLTLLGVQRGNDYGGDGGGCRGGTVTSCDGIAYVKFAVSAQDDLGPVGYRVEGPRLEQSGQLLLPDPQGELMLFLEGDDSGEQDLQLTLKVAAVDQAGNVSEVRSLEVRDEGDGCQLARRGSGLSALLLALTLATRSALSRRARGAAASRP